MTARTPVTWKLDQLRELREEHEERLAQIGEVDYGPIYETFAEARREGQPSRAIIPPDIYRKLVAIERERADYLDELDDLTGRRRTYPALPPLEYDMLFGLPVEVAETESGHVEFE